MAFEDIMEKYAANLPDNTKAEETVVAGIEVPIPEVAEVTPIANQPIVEDVNVGDDAPEWARTLFADDSKPVVAEVANAAAAEATTPTNVIPDDIAARLKEYDELMKNPLISKAAEYVKSGKTDPNGFLTAIAGEDHSSKSDSDIMKMYLESQDGITPDDVEDEMDKFNSLKPWQQKRETAPLRAALDETKAEKLKSLTFEAQPKPDTEFLIKAQKEAASELPNVIERYKKSGYLATKVTDEMAVAIDHYIRNVEAVPIIKDGKFAGYDTQKSVERAFKELYFNKIVSDAAKAAASDAKIKGIIERQRPSNGVTPTNRTQGEVTKEESVKSAMAQFIKPHIMPTFQKQSKN